MLSWMLASNMVLSRPQRLVKHIFKFQSRGSCYFSTPQIAAIFDNLLWYLFLSLPSSFSHTPLAYYFPTDNYRTDFAVKIAHASSSSARQFVWCPWFHLSQSLYEETEDMTSPRFSFPVISVISVFSCSVFLYLNWSRHYQNTTCYHRCSWGSQ